VVVISVTYLVCQSNGSGERIKSWLAESVVHDSSASVDNQSYLVGV
jgi:hypothetical protein